MRRLRVFSAHSSTCREHRYRVDDGVWRHVYRPMCAFASTLIGVCLQTEAHRLTHTHIDIWGDHSFEVWFVHKIVKSASVNRAYIHDFRMRCTTRVLSACGNKRIEIGSFRSVHVIIGKRNRHSLICTHVDSPKMISLRQSIEFIFRLKCVSFPSTIGESLSTLHRKQ